MLLESTSCLLSWITLCVEGSRTNLCARQVFAVLKIVIFTPLVVIKFDEATSHSVVEIIFFVKGVGTEDNLGGVSGMVLRLPDFLLERKCPG